jgi:flagellum-specific ATP synthase
MTSLIDTEHGELVRRFKQLYSRYQRARDLLAVGAYSPGSDPLLDQAIALYPHMERFLQQDIAERANSESSINDLTALFG